MFEKDIQEPGSPSDDLMIVSPDVGGVVRARATGEKRLDKPTWPSSTSAASGQGVSEVMNVIGDVQGRRCILVIDDIVDSAGTLCNAAVALMEAGAPPRSSTYITHGVLSGGAVARVDRLGPSRS